jgi:hypothetical protein
VSFIRVEGFNTPPFRALKKVIKSAGGGDFVGVWLAKLRSCLVYLLSIGV